MNVLTNYFGFMFGESASPRDFDWMGLFLYPIVLAVFIGYLCMHSRFGGIKGWLQLQRARMRRSGRWKKGPSGTVVIPAGSFTMGDIHIHSKRNDERPTHTVHISAFRMDQYKVTERLWDNVIFVPCAWALARHYDFSMYHSPRFNPEGTGQAYEQKGPGNHPCIKNWHDVITWCNMRSDKDGLEPVYYSDAAMTQVYETAYIGENSCPMGAERRYWVNPVGPFVKWTANGYRLPTEAEWEYAARGGLSGKRFPWGDTISHSQANYYSYDSDHFDVSPTRRAHPNYHRGSSGFGHSTTSPVGSFPPNGYGLYDMAGNQREWCWDRYGPYSSDEQTDPRGPTSGSEHATRGGSHSDGGSECRVAARSHYSDAGFRCVRSL